MNFPSSESVILDPKKLQEFLDGNSGVTEQILSAAESCDPALTDSFIQEHIPAAEETMSAFAAEKRKQLESAEDRVAAAHLSWLDQLIQEADVSQQALRAKISKISVAQRPSLSVEDCREYDGATARDQTGLPEFVPCGFARRGDIDVPIYLPFVRAAGPLIFSSNNDEERTRSLDLVQSIIWSIALTLPGQVCFHFFDPHNSDISFMWANRLPGREKPSGDMARDLTGVESAFRRNMELFLGPTVQTFADVDPKQRRREKLHVVVIADFPRGFENDYQSLEVLRRIADNGIPGGAHLLLHWDRTAPSPSSFRADPTKGLGYKTPVYVETVVSEFLKANRLELKAWARPPEPACLADLSAKLTNASEITSDIAFKNVISKGAEHWWSESSTRAISTSIGTSGSDEEPLRILFGENEQGYPCVHGFVAADSGQGKSNMLHVMILGLAQRYSPKELRFYLVDLKMGVEFEVYRNLPHASVLSLDTAPELACSLLLDLKDQMAQRNSAFKRAGVSSFRDYRELCAKRPELACMPRLLLLVDEYQELFKDNRDQDGATATVLATLTAQGRSVGIHILLVSQRLAVSGMQRRDEIFSQLTQRIAMRLCPADMASITDFEREGKEAIKTLDGPGKIVINEKSGQDRFNKRGIVARAPEKLEHVKLVDELAELSRKRGHGELRPIVFSGSAQPRLRDNPIWSALIGRPAAPSPQELEAFASKSVEEQGAEIPGWYHAEQPRIGWVGQEINVRGHAKVVLRRQSANHVLIIGSSHNARYGMMLSLLTGFAANLRNKATEFVLIDRSARRSPWEGILPRWKQRIAEPAAIPCCYATDKLEVEKAFLNIGGEIRRRLLLPDANRLDEPTLIIAITEPERVDSVRPLDPYAPSSGSQTAGASEAFQLILQEGSSVGVHLVLSTAGLSALKTICDVDRVLPFFRTRLILQLTDDEAYKFDANRRLTQLQAGGPVPVYAIIQNTDEPIKPRFKPYFARTVDGDKADGGPGVLDDLDAVAARLQLWAQQGGAL